MRGELEGEPFFQAGAAEGVQAVEEGEGLVEDFGADLLFEKHISIRNKNKITCDPGRPGKQGQRGRQSCQMSHHPSSPYRGAKDWGPTHRARQLLL
jgi:hypothetical protein